VHHNPQRYHINRTLRAELGLIRDALALPPSFHACPIAHLVPRTPIACVRGDASLAAAGGYSADLGFWWHIEWPPDIRARTLRHKRDNTDNKLISINQLEYAVILINYVAASWRITTLAVDDPFPIVRIESDNTTSEAWSRYGCKDSFGGRALSRIHSALLLGNPVGLQVARIATEDNVIADRISRIPHTSDLLDAFPLLLQDHTALRGCQRFLPNAALILAIMAALSEHASPHPVALSRQVLTNPGCFTSSPGVSACTWTTHA
jgi:hypothetical protein